MQVFPLSVPMTHRWGSLGMQVTPAPIASHLSPGYVYCDLLYRAEGQERK